MKNLDNYNSLSELIFVALEDLNQLRLNPDYEVDMRYFHYPRQTDSDNICHICLAGAVMSKQLNIQKNQERVPRQFSQATQQKLDALDSIRIGDIYGAIWFFYNLPDYRNSDEDFTPVADYPSTINAQSKWIMSIADIAKKVAQIEIDMNL